MPGCDGGSRPSSARPAPMSDMPSTLHLKFCVDGSGSVRGTVRLNVQGGLVRAAVRFLAVSVLAVRFGSGAFYDYREGVQAGVSV